jgi:hypothetical protein
MREDGILWKLLLLTLLARSALFGDGGTLQLRGETPDLVVTVFTSPAPLTAGPADVSVLLQKRETSEPILDAEVSIVMRTLASGSEIRVQATREQAQNKLLYAAPLTLGESGTWRIEVNILRFGVKSQINGTIWAAPNQQKLETYWSYLAFPPLTVLLFIVREWLVRRHKSASKGKLCASAWS